MLNESYFDLAIGEFEDIIYQERTRYLKVFNIIDQYLSEHVSAVAEKSDMRIMLGGSTSINLTLKLDRSQQDFKYALYTEKPLYHANNLANIIDEKFNDGSHIVIMTTVLYNKHFSIFVDTRLVCDIIKVPENTTIVLMPIISKSFSNLSILLMSPRFHLLEIYQNLYSPVQYENWANIMADEKKIFSHLRMRVDTSAKKSKEAKNIHRDRIEGLVLEKFIKNNNTLVLIGEFAIALLFPIEQTRIIKVISEQKFDDVFKELHIIFAEQGITLQRQIDNVEIIGDYKLKRMSIKYIHEDKSIELMYVYNSAQYELIPYNKITSQDSFIYIASPFVLLRFLLIDMWTIQKLIVSDKINEEFGNLKTSRLFEILFTLRDSLRYRDKSDIDSKLLQTGALGIFHPENYIGVYVDKVIAQKVFNLSNKRGYDYFPRWYKNHGEYREIPSTI